MAEGTTEPTPAASEVTANAGEQSQSGESGNQEDLAAKVREYESQLKDLNEIKSRAETLEEARKRAEADAIRWQATYKGLQRQATQKLQEYAQLQKEVQTNQKTEHQLAAIQEYMSLLASKVLEPDEAKAMQLQMREAAIKAQEEMLRNGNNTQNQNTQQIDFTDPDAEVAAKKQFLEQYFPGQNIDPNDPTIDWGTGAMDTADAWSRFTRSVTNVIAGKREAPAPQKSAEEIMKEQMEQLQAQWKTEREELQKSVEDAKNQARKEVEEKARSMGIDTTATPTAEPVRKINASLMELDENLLSQGKKGQLEYQRQLAEIQKQMRNR